MAATDQTAAQLEIANSLAQDDIPFKLRCAICNKLALNAFRLPCCDQAICENCQQALPENCPVCDHSPISPDLCKPNKALRTTIKVFLRTEEKKRESLKEKIQPSIERRDSTSVAPETPVVNGTGDLGKRDEGITIEAEKEMNVELGGSTLEPEGGAEAQNGHSASRGPSAEGPRISEAPEDQGREGRSTQPLEVSRGDSAAMQQDQDNDQSLKGGQDRPGTGPANQTQQFPNGYGMNMSGGSGMSWNGQPDYNPMMQFMNNGMMPNAMGGFPNMMSMSPFGMDPMAAQGMFGGYGGMGMSGIGMGMNFNAGQGMYSGWDGQNNMWNGAQNNNNPNAFPNGMGAFGPNSGYGHNMNQQSGNFSHVQHQQQFPNQDYQQQGYNSQYGRGRGRGRGYGYGNRGRGGFGQQTQGNQGNYGAHQNQVPYQTSQQNSPHHQEEATTVNGPAPQAETRKQPEDNDTEQTHGKITIPHEESKKDPEEMTTQVQDEGQIEGHDLTLASGNSDPSTRETHQTHEETIGQPEVQIRGELLDDQQSDLPKAETAIPTSEKPHFEPVRSILDITEPEQTLPSLNEADMQDTPMSSGVESFVQNSTTVMAPPTAPVGPAARYTNEMHEAPYRGRGGLRGSYRGGFRGRGSGFIPNGNFHSPPVISPVEAPGQGVIGAPTGPKAMREGHGNVGMRAGMNGRANAPPPIPAGPRKIEVEESKSPNRHRDDDESRTRSQSRSRTRSQSRSRSPTQHRSRRHRHRRHRSSSPSGSETERDKKHERRHRRSRQDEEDNRSEREEENSRSSTPLSSRISSHRSHRDKDRRSSHKHRSSHRSHRHRSRSREYRHQEKSSLIPQVNDTERDNEHDEYAEEKRNEDPSGRGGNDGAKRYRDEAREERHRDRKRPRRDRSPSPDEADTSTYRESRRQKRGAETDGPPPVINAPKGPRQMMAKAAPQPEKDPHTLEREARDRERMLKEQQRREAMNVPKGPSGLKRKESRQSDGGMRRMSYKHEDENNSARAARIEQERESGRWS